MTTAADLADRLTALDGRHPRGGRGPPPPGVAPAPGLRRPRGRRRTSGPTSASRSPTWPMPASPPSAARTSRRCWSACWAEVDGSSTHTFFSYRIAETLGRAGPFAGNRLVADLDDDQRAELVTAVDSSDWLELLDAGALPRNYAAVLARCEQGRVDLGLVDDTGRLDSLTARVAEVLGENPRRALDDSHDRVGRYDIYTADVWLFCEPLAPRLGPVWADGLRQGPRPGRHRRRPRRLGRGVGAIGGRPVRRPHPRAGRPGPGRRPRPRPRGAVAAAGGRRGRDGDGRLRRRRRRLGPPAPQPGRLPGPGPAPPAHLRPAGQGGLGRGRPPAGRPRPGRRPDRRGLPRRGGVGALRGPAPGRGLGPPQPRGGLRGPVRRHHPQPLPPGPVPARAPGRCRSTGTCPPGHPWSPPG